VRWLQPGSQASRLVELGLESRKLAMNESREAEDNGEDTAD
jgi:hypothetical protein